MKWALPRMISKGEKEKPSAAAPLFVKAYFVYSLDILFNEFIQVLSLLFLFPFAYHPREWLFHL